ncbi:MULTISPECIES: uracil-xanthine permease family protein [Coprobacillaceae]|uniref:uracil-xanthine permease family protein n=1 Tax=Coprobacillaceae TaxID=2810280 RepID=UPI000E49946C|nr:MULTISPECIES: solute carrier family 23 protein [Coprobacillaceae]RHM62613.1 uracil permease [Coprobacillus sp. AF33-1AC]RHS92242.1 uracil permease [Erysipelatoclostridium sp. AM42-17]
MEKSKNLIIDVNEKPNGLQWIFLSFQHVFAMFGATILVPILTGFPVSVALFASGIGTLIYTMCTKRKVPVYLGSSFAYITAVQLAVKSMGGDVSAAQTGLMLVGLIYVIIAIIIKFVGKDWIDRLLPPIVIGPMIAVIGLGLASNAITNAGFVLGGEVSYMIVAIVTFLVAALVSSQAKGFLKIVPFLIAILVGYVLSLCFGIVDLSGVSKAAWISIPQFKFPFHVPGFDSYHLHFGPETWAVLPVAIVTVSEHIGDHTVLGKICGLNFLKDPGLDRTLIGDGLATTVSAFIGGPANTTYGENTGVIGLTKIGSVYVTCGAACIAILLSFCGKIAALISSIPNCVLGGMSILLYGVIASNGLRILIDEKVDFSKQRNLIIASAMLVIGLGGAVFPLGGSATLSGTALAAIVGVLLNLILPMNSN